MGTTSVYIFKNKKWQEIDDSNIDGSFCNTNHLYDKYFPNLPKKSTGNSQIPLENFNEFSNSLLKIKDLKWYEKTAFLLTKNFSYFQGKDLPLVIKSLELINQDLKEFTLDNFNTQFISFLKQQNFDNDDIISLGYSSGGFWGTDAEPVLSSLSFKISESLNDKFYDGLNLIPSYFGNDIFQDFSE